MIVQAPRTLREVLEYTRTQRTIVTVFIFLLSTTGIILAATGLYALISFTVSQRTREIGIRTALGAGGRNVVATIARRAFYQLAGGLVLGCLLGWWILSLISDSSEFAVSSVPMLLLGVSTAVMAVSALAVPAADPPRPPDPADGGAAGGVGADAARPHTDHSSSQGRTGSRGRLADLRPLRGSCPHREGRSPPDCADSPPAPTVAERGPV